MNTAGPGFAAVGRAPTKRPAVLWLAAALAGPVLALLGLAQQPAAPAPMPPSASAEVDAPATYPLSAKSPLETFRELLAMPPGERKRALASRPAEVQRALLAKVREYESMNPTQRELRLKSTELYYYLWPVMNSPLTNRPTLLALVPERDRKEIAKRLKAWDAYPTSRQQELLTNSLALRFYSELKSGPPPLPPVSPAEQQKLDRGIRQWQALGPAQRKKLMARFDRFFELTPEEQQRACNTLSEPERRQIEQTLRRFEDLSPADRAKCLRGFEKFASLSSEQRLQFLKNAQMWKLLAPEQRQSWRDLVDDLPLVPPEPPGLTPPPEPPGRTPPPAPPGFAPRGSN